MVEYIFALNVSSRENGRLQHKIPALRLVATRACAEGETIHHEPMPVSPKVVVAALKAADAYGRKRACRKKRP